MEQDYIRIDPKCLWVDRISDADVPAGALSEAHPRKDAKSASHVLQLPLPLGVQVRELGYTRILVPSRRNGRKVLIGLAGAPTGGRCTSR